MDSIMMESYEHWKLKIDENNILWLTFDRKDSRVNSLNEATFREFDQILNSLNQNKRTRALIIQSGKKNGFIVGADINQFKSLESAEEATQLIRKGQEIFDKLEALEMTSIALIQGPCLGGGLELALACQYRLAQNSFQTRIGFPEVKLGIHPGWGGTVRLPKLVGPLQAMDLILTGRNISPKAAEKMGVIDEAVPLRLLEKAALDYALNPPPHKQHYVYKAMNSPLSRRMLAPFFIHQLRKKVNSEHYHSPYQVVKNWAKHGVEPSAMNAEAESIGSLLVSDTSRNLVRVFFLQEGLKSQGKSKDFNLHHVHVIGAGVMGGDIAAWCALRGFKVTLQDQAPKLIGNAFERAYDLAKKKLKETTLIQEMMDRFHPDPAGEGIKNADLIIEAITEKVEAKQELFAFLEERAKKEALFATNTSTIPLEEIGIVLKDNGRLVGIHFFNPVAKMPLVEIVQGRFTNPKAIALATAFVSKIDKLPLQVKSAPGFLVNRILMPYMLEAVSLLEEGVFAPMIDKCATEFGMPMGPIELADTVGLDICLAALEKLAATEDMKVPALLKEYVSRGELGRKTGKGFYEYRKGKAIKPKIPQNASLPPDVSDRLILRLLNEAVSCLREGIVDNADHLDAGCIFGFGFAPFRGGPIHYAKTKGWANLQKQLNDLQDRYGDRFAADEGWQEEVA